MARLAYFFSTFPSLSETFVVNQVRATRRLGLDCVLAANRRPGPGRFHPQDQDLGRQTFYLSPVRAWPYAALNLKALARRPQLYLHALKLAAQLRNGHPGQSLLNLAHLAGAAVLAEHLRARQVRQVHVHYAYGAAEVALFLKALSGLPYSLTIHGSDVLLPNRLLEAKLKDASFIVSNCQYHLSLLRRQFPSLQRQHCYVVRGGVDLSTPPWNLAPPAAVELPLRLLKVARLVPVKAHEVLIHACGRLRRQGIAVDCRLVGDGPEHRALQALIHDLGLEDAVKLLGPRYADDLTGLYEWSQVVVLSSRSEGTPMTVIEAMAKARPVVAPRITALPEMVVDGVTGLLFDPGAADDLAKKLAILAHRPELVLSLGAAGRQRAENLFDVRRNARDLMAIFAQEIPALGLATEEVVPYA